jgi:hypothetical protein
MRPDLRIDPEEGLSSLFKIQQEQAIIADWNRVANLKSTTAYPTGERHIDVYWQTLIGNYAPGGRDVAFKSFLSWRKFIRWFGVARFFKSYSIFVFLFAFWIFQYHCARRNRKWDRNIFLSYMFPSKNRRLARTLKGFFSATAVSGWI